MDDKKKILVIDDDLDICRTLSLYLDISGFAVESSFTGKEGIEKAKQGRPDLVVLDLMLPDMPGEEVCRQLKHDEILSKIPVIMLTAKNSDIDKIIGRVIGADSYLYKPVELEDLRKKIVDFI